MTDLQVVEPHAAAAGTPALRAPVSRRRVLHGIAWGTPAILIATASPPAAASVTVTPGGASTAPGAHAFYGVAAGLGASTLIVRSALTYVAPSSPATGLPVSNIVVKISIPNGRLANNTVGLVGAGWAPSGTPTSTGGNTVFSFVWNGTDLSSTFNSTTELLLTFQRNSTSTPLAVGFEAAGVSNSAPILPATATATALVIAVPIKFYHGGAIAWEEWFSSNPKTSAYRFNAALWWNGSYNPVAADITDLAVEFRIPDNRTDGTILPHGQGIGAGWTAVNGGPVHTGSYWYFRYTYSGAIGAANSGTTPLMFAVKSTGTPTAGTVQYTLTGKSSGIPVVTTGTAP